MEIATSQSCLTSVSIRSVALHTLVPLAVCRVADLAHENARLLREGLENILAMQIHTNLYLSNGLLHRARVARDLQER